MSPPIARVFGARCAHGGYRIAPDEWLLLGDDASAALADVDPDTIDFSSGFICLELCGPERERAFSYLSDLVLPEEDRPALVQGHVAEVAAKVIVGIDDLLLLVPPHVAHHVRDQILGLGHAGFTVEEVSGAERAPA